MGRRSSHETQRAMERKKWHGRAAKKGAALVTFLQSSITAHQFVPPNQHRTNRAERAVITGKNHFLSVLSAVHISFPPNRWPALLPLTELTLNHMRAFSLDPSISAWHGIQGQALDFAAPIHPAGQLVVAHDPPPTRVMGEARYQRIHLSLPCPIALPLSCCLHPLYSCHPHY